MPGNGRAALAARMGGHLVQFQAVKRTASRPTSGPDAWQRPGSSRAARCVSLGGSVVTYVSNLDTISAPRSASNPHTSADFGHSWPSRWAAPGHGSGRSGGQPDRPPAGHSPDAGQGPDGSRAVRYGSLGRLWPRGWVVLGHGSGRSAGRPAGRQMAVRKATGRMLGRGWAAPGRCAVPPWGGPGRAGRRYWSQLRAVRRTASRPTSGPSRKQRGRMLDRGRATAGGVLRRPGRLWPRGWAAPGPAPGSPEGRPGGPQAGLVEGHGPDAWQGADASRAARYTSLGVSGRAGGRHLVIAPGSQEDGQTGRQWAARGPQAGRWAEARRLQRGALRLPGWLWQ